MATKSERLQEVLTDLRQETGDIEASAVVSVDGLMIASDLPRDVGKETVAAMSAAMLSIGKRAAQELSRGRLNQVFIDGSEGSKIIMTAGDRALLAALARPNANLGLVFLEMKRAADNIAGIV
ncbi:MAG: roadblock/LC7 domain-containing protein [candidate division KSB1 bacterium]|nr:roadblock/LC7 domain-containing protein [candidate division KSB1 bacterium]MDZ7275808.1 roadblock/LC7 domain-containing protein [candidate division KSB1 bacterium]MDZ7287559.1 roadblock/LC7 domain-containing protein [candidate division KSB1 bacterium]MDZ7308037.1 roadblock/LC7 domain-containing protein [candidate division KSB1 bacterium]MDZ7350537.1 roadblock/LC7 domain-containing protein [candidate division KSB1 bacterium]